ncbi:unnamed protein product [Closterium sp. NIES-65]|nr:unnamed protein product [Closterium sp. NIES-65]
MANSEDVIVPADLEDDVAGWCCSCCSGTPSARRSPLVPTAVATSLDIALSSFSLALVTRTFYSMMSTPNFSEASHNLLAASIRRRWRRLARSHVSALCVKQERIVSRKDVLNAVACFPKLTYLHLSDGSVETLDDYFLAQLASSCPHLTAFHVGESIAQDRDPHWRETGERQLTEAGLDDFFRHCTGLELSLCCFRGNDTLPASLFKLPHLRVLLLNTAVILQHPELKSLTSLTALSIETSNVDFQQLSSLLHLTRLTKLSLPRNVRVTREGLQAFTFLLLPSLESLKVGFNEAQFHAIFSSTLPCLRLKRLHLTHCNEQRRLPDNIGEALPSLEDLTFTFCESLTNLTEDFTASTCLTSLTISRSSMVKLPRDFGSLSALKTLVLHSLPLYGLPASFCQLSSLETLFLIDCKHLDCLPEGFGCLISLKYLSLVDFPQLELPKDIGELINLHTRSANRPLPPSFTQLVSLIRLELDNCLIAELPEGLNQLRNLQQLYVQSCPSLKKLLEFVTGLISLRILSIDKCSGLRTVPMSLDSLTRLKQLELTGCEQLKESPKFLPLTLEVLSLGNYEKPTALPDMSGLTNLRKLCLRTIEAGCWLPISNGLSSLEDLSLIMADNAEELLISLAGPSRLRTLNIGSARNLRRLPDLSPLQDLRQLGIDMAEQLTELPATITSLQHLTSIDIYAPKLTYLPEGIGALSRLRKLSLTNCFSITCLPPSLSQLSCLHYLKLNNVFISSLPENFGQLTRLKDLCLHGCMKLEALPEDLAELKLLGCLDTEGCYKLYGPMQLEMEEDW